MRFQPFFFSSAMKSRSFFLVAAVSFLSATFSLAILNYSSKAETVNSPLMSQLATENLVGELETVATFSGPMPAGVTVSDDGRIFVTFPRWGDEVPFTVGEVIDGEVIAY